MIKITFEQLDGTEFDVSIKVNDTEVANEWIKHLETADPSTTVLRKSGFSDVKTAITKLNAATQVITAAFPELVISKITSTYKVEQVAEINAIISDFLRTYEGDTTAVSTAFTTASTIAYELEGKLNSDYRTFAITASSELPETKFQAEDYLDATYDYEFGTVYLSQHKRGQRMDRLAKLGSTDLTNLVAYDSFTSGFEITWHEADDDAVARRLQLCREWFETHKAEMAELGYTKWDTPELLPGLVPVGKVDTTLTKTELLAKLANSLAIKSIELT